MKYASVFLIAGILLLRASLELGLLGGFLAWLGLDFAIAAAGYAGLGAKVFGKQPDGSIAPFNWILLLPFFLLNGMLWHLWRICSRAQCCCEFAPGIWLGRRALAGELPENITLLVDLTAEFPEPKTAIAGKTYLCIPTLDACSPPVDVLRELAATISTWQGKTYIHCAAGHGRSATVAAAVLLARGWDRQSVEAHLQTVRPGIALNAAQRTAITQF